MAEYMAIITDLLNEIINWLLGIDATVTIIKLLYLAQKYKTSTSAEKNDIVINARSTFYWGVGIFLVLGLLSYISGKFKGKYEQLNPRTGFMQIEHLYTYSKCLFSYLYL